MPDQMTRRDTVALKALELLLPHRDGVAMVYIARDCYAMADAMETARNPTPTKIHPDTTRLDWMLAMLGDRKKTIALARLIANGLKGRAALDTLQKVCLITRL